MSFRYRTRKSLHESPALITFPLIVLAILAAIGGLISFPTNSWLSGYLAPLFEVATEEHHFGTQEYILMAIAVIGGLVGIVAFSKYIKQNQVPAADAEINGFAKVFYNKYYVDEAYDYFR
jgi:NADH-quinone oxidoreductase subunit L